MSNVEELALAIEIAFQLECSSCGETDQTPISCHAIEAAKLFEKDGWSVVDGQAVCPECNKAR